MAPYFSAEPAFGCVPYGLRITRRPKWDRCCLRPRKYLRRQQCSLPALDLNACARTVMPADGNQQSLDTQNGTQKRDTIRPRTDRVFSVLYDDLVIRGWREHDRDACASLIGTILSEYGLDWDPAGADRDVVEVETAYRDGEFWVIENVQTSEIVGTAAFYEVPHRGVGAVEIRKMYLSRESRGRGLGSFLLSALEQRAIQLGYSKAFIETASVLKEACILYERTGYLPSTGLDTKRCDTILEKVLQPLQPEPGVEHVEIVDMTRGWTVTRLTRKQTLEHRIPYRAVLVLVESQRRIFVHKRSMKKSTYPGRMAVFITGCVDWDENPLASAMREVKEEIGLSRLKFFQPFDPFVSKGSDGLGQRIKFHPFIAQGDFNEADIVCDPEEVEYGEFMSREEIIQKGIGGSLWQEFRARGL